MSNAKVLVWYQDARGLTLGVLGRGQGGVESVPYNLLVVSAQASGRVIEVAGSTSIVGVRIPGASSSDQVCLRWLLH